MAGKRMHTPKLRARGAGASEALRVYRPGPAIADEKSLAAAVAALGAQDPGFVAPLLAFAGPPPLRRREPGFAGLAAIVVSQQVSVASASSILARLEARVAPLDAERLAAASDDDLKSCGLSTAKVRTLRAVAEATLAGVLDLGGLADLDAEAAHRALVAVKGIGPWTADIFLFCLGHPDAFPAGDVALQEAARLALDLAARPDAAALERIAERWRPWRAVAARLLWTYYRAVKARSGMALADGSG
jgi:DNA-3-methyladenine glycosylase II